MQRSQITPQIMNTYYKFYQPLPLNFQIAMYIKQIHYVDNYALLFAIDLIV